jgi:hypothetical protein
LDAALVEASAGPVGVGMPLACRPYRWREIALIVGLVFLCLIATASVFTFPPQLEP